MQYNTGTIKRNIPLSYLIKKPTAMQAAPGFMIYSSPGLQHNLVTPGMEKIFNGQD
jgi:hypothetical protein